MSTPSVDAGREKGQPAWSPRDSSPENQRLSAAIEKAASRLRRLKTDQKPTAVIEACQRALDTAIFKAGGNSHYMSWDCLHQFDAAYLEAMSDDERQAHWCALLAEADAKLTGWRFKAAQCLKTMAASHEGPVPLHLVAELQSHLATNAQNNQFKQILVRKGMFPTLRWILAGVIAVALGLAMVVFTVDRYRDFEDWAKAIMLGVPAGALGGIVSMAFSIGRADLKARIPELRFSNVVTTIRPLIGAVVAIPILVLVKADVVSVLQIDEWKEIFVFCFIGGRSERWFLGLMESIENLQTS